MYIVLKYSHFYNVERIVLRIQSLLMFDHLF